MSEQTFLKNYFSDLKKLINENEYIDKLLLVKNILKSVSSNKKKTMIFGNGGSAAIASHFSVDLTKNAKIRCTNYNESDLLTCFSNDFGYENWVQKAIEFYADAGDALILISAGGNSKNMVNAANFAKKKNISKIAYPNTWKLIKKNNHYFYQDKKNRIRLKTENIHSKGLLENLCHAIKISLDLKIDRSVIEKTIPHIVFEGRFQYLKNGKIKNKLHKNEKILLDGAHAETDAKNLANYLKNIKVPKYAVWAMMRNKEPDLFIKQFRGIFKKIITIPIENEKNCVSAKELEVIAKKNQLNVDKASNFNEAIRKITSADKKLIICIGSLYNVGNILNTNQR